MPDPVLRPPDFARIALLSTNLPHQFSMQFCNESRANWKVGKSRKPVMHCADVVNHLANIIWPVRLKEMSFGFQNVCKRGLRSLDLAGENSFFPDIHQHKQVRIG